MSLSPLIRLRLFLGERGGLMRTPTLMVYCGHERKRRKYGRKSVDLSPTRVSYEYNTHTPAPRKHTGHSTQVRKRGMGHEPSPHHT